MGHALTQAVARVQSVFARPRAGAYLWRDGKYRRFWGLGDFQETQMTSCDRDVCKQWPDAGGEAARRGRT